MPYGHGEVNVGLHVTGFIEAMVFNELIMDQRGADGQTPYVPKFVLDLAEVHFSIKLGQCRDLLATQYPAFLLRRFSRKTLALI